MVLAVHYRYFANSFPGHTHDSDYNELHEDVDDVHGGGDVHCGGGDVRRTWSTDSGGRRPCSAWLGWKRTWGLGCTGNIWLYVKLFLIF